MKDLQTLIGALDRNGGKALPTAQLVDQIQSARPLDREDLSVLIRCIAECSEQIYEHYRALIDIFRAEILQTTPDDTTVRLGVDLGLLDDEVWLPRKEG